MQLYGYAQENTPFQASLKNSKNFFVFNNAFSAYPLASQAIFYSLTDQRQYDGANKKKQFSHAISLLDLAQFNGFNTAWLSGQKANHFFNPRANVISQCADCYLDRRDVERKLHRHCYDLDFAKELPELFREDYNLVVFHLFGSHYPYKHAVPKNFRAPDGFSDYETTLLYTDEVIKKIFSMKDKLKLDAIIFCADHGEAVSNGKTHDPREHAFTQEMVEIPFWCWLSDDFMQKYPELPQQLRNAENKIFTNDLLMDFMLALMKIDSVYSPHQYSIISEDYFLTPNNARTIGGTVPLEINNSSN
jgi:heptose-I-phosphate ethanolaminephosphotransferase